MRELPLMPQEMPNHHNIPTSPDALRERLFAQDKRLTEAANRLATIIRAMPHDPKYPETPPRALIVGGFARDAALGKQPKDIDVEIYGVSPERLESVLEQLFPGLVNAVGRSFGVLKIHLAEDIEFDVSIPRHESKTGTGHRGFEISSDPSMDVKEAARRRDFTMNSISADPLSGEYFDPFHGLEDLRAGVLRVTDPERFQDDPLRVYRAVQFVARMDLTVEPQSLELLREMVARGDLETLAAERVTEELKKLLLKSDTPSKGFELLRELGITKRYFPELHALIDTPQEKEWHPEGDVWIHTMMVADAAAKIIRDPKRGLLPGEDIDTMVGALCHDLGKPSTTQLQNGRIRALGHEEAGKEPTEQLLGRLSFSDRTKSAAIAIATDHLKPGTFYRAYEKGELDDKSYPNAVRKLLKRIHPTSWRVLLAASEADHRGRTVPGAATEPYLAGEHFSQTITAKDLDQEPTKPLLQGRDLLALGLKPGPGIGALIKKIEAARDEGKITTPAEAIALARQELGL